MRTGAKNQCALDVTWVYLWEAQTRSLLKTVLSSNLTNFCIVIENVHCCAILACVNMGGVDTKSLILCFDLVWCHHPSQQRFLSGLLVASCLPRLEISFSGGLWCLFPAERDL